jgi:anti-sigma B factor antagonist
MLQIASGELKDRTLCLTVHGPRLDAASAREFKKVCDECWEAGIERLTIDLREVEFLDSSGVGALLSVYKKLPPDKPSVKLLHVQPAVQTVIELLRLHRIFTIVA